MTLLSSYRNENEYIFALKPVKWFLFMACNGFDLEEKDSERCTGGCVPGVWVITFLWGPQLPLSLCSILECVGAGGQFDILKLCIAAKANTKILNRYNVPGFAWATNSLSFLYPQSHHSQRGVSPP